MEGMHYLMVLLCLSFAHEALAMLERDRYFPWKDRSHLFQNVPAPGPRPTREVETLGLPTPGHDAAGSGEHGEGPTIEDEETVEGSADNQMCSPCQCKCHYPSYLLASNTPKASVLVDKQLTAIRATLDSNTALLRAINTQVGFVQHDLESPRDTGCPDDFLFDRETNMCLQFHVDRKVTKLNWAQAQHYCQHLGPKTHLAIIDTPDKLELVREHLRQADLPLRTRGGWDRGAWLGGMQAENEGRWFWAATGELLQQRGGMWGTNQPDNNEEDGNCLQLVSAHPFPDWMFDDTACDNERLYICERHLD